MLTPPVGDHTLILTLPGFRTTTHTIKVTDPMGELPVFTISQASGILMLQTDPNGASVTVDGRRWPGTTPTQIGLPAGKHRLIVEKGDLKTTQDVEIRDGDLEASFCSFGTTMTIDSQFSRRRLFRLMEALAGAISAGAAEDAKLLVRSVRPEDFEMPLEGFDNWITPVERFFVRSHMSRPDRRLGVLALERRGRSLVAASLTMDDLKNGGGHDEHRQVTGPAQVRARRERRGARPRRGHPQPRRAAVGDQRGKPLGHRRVARREHLRGERVLRGPPSAIRKSGRLESTSTDP